MDFGQEIGALPGKVSQSLGFPICAQGPQLGIPPEEPKGNGEREQILRPKRSLLLGCPFSFKISGLGFWVNPNFLGVGNFKVGDPGTGEFGNFFKQNLGAGFWGLGAPGLDFGILNPFGLGTWGLGFGFWAWDFWVFKKGPKVSGKNPIFGTNQKGLFRERGKNPILF